MTESTVVAAPGVPGWVDIASGDIEATKAFYSGLLGWEIETQTDPAAGGYALCKVGGEVVAGMSPAQPGQPEFWSTYVIVDDADDAQRKAEAAGGKVLVPAMDVMNHGRLAVFMDPTGAAIAVWQPLEMPGATVFNVPGALCWNELATRDVAGAKKFYNAVFGWETKDMPQYHEWKLGSRTIGGLMPISETMPAEMPAAWVVYFAVANLESSLEKATKLGATVVVPTMTIDSGSFAVITDTRGATVALIELRG